MTVFNKEINLLSSFKNKTVNSVYGLAGLHVALSRHQILKSQAKESSVSSESHVTEWAHTVQLLKQALPVRFDGNGAWSVLAIQVSVQDVYGLLVHCWLKLAGKECRTGQLLWIREKKVTEISLWDTEPNWCYLNIRDNHSYPVIVNFWLEKSVQVQHI